MHGEGISYAYGFWSLVIVNIGLFAFFIISFLAPIKKREWRSMGATLAFLLTFLGGGAVMMTVIHLVSNGLVIIGFAIMWKGWKLIHGAKGELVTSGPYAYVRHPQYAGLFIIMVGMLIQWPTILTAVMFPVLAFVYYRLSKREEGEMIKLFGDEYKRYMVKTPMFIPKLNNKIKQKIHRNEKVL